MNEKALWMVEQTGFLVMMVAGVLIRNNILVGQRWGAIFGIILVALSVAGMIASLLRLDRDLMNGKNGDKTSILRSEEDG